MKRVLLVEDDARLASLVTDYLRGYEFEVEVCGRGDLALAHFQKARPDMVVLDLSLPGLDGLEVCRQIRAVSAAPIVILTAREDAFDEVCGLESGADDYVNKPVQPRVLLARLRALARRAGAPQAVHGSDLEIGRLRISRENYSVFWRDEAVVLTHPDFKVLLVLAEAVGKVQSRNDIFLKVRGLEFSGLDRSIDNCISRLRRKFDDAQAEKIKTVWGEGYLLSPSAWE